MTQKNKTLENDDNVTAFIESVVDQKKRSDAFQLLQIMYKQTGETPKMWGQSIVGFGKYHYKYESGREGDFMKVGFSPRKNALSVYIMPGFEKYESIMEQLGKYKTGKSCLYIKRLEDVDLVILSTLIKESYMYMTNKYG